MFLSKEKNKIISDLLADECTLTVGKRRGYCTDGRAASRQPTAIQAKATRVSHHREKKRMEVFTRQRALAIMMRATKATRKQQAVTKWWW
jgi:hypothetical protein